MIVQILRSAAGLSILLHVLILLSFLVMEKYTVQPPPPPKVTYVEVPPLPPPHKNRLVQTEAGEKQDRAPDDAYLGFQNQTVDRQTVSRNRRILSPTRGSTTKGKGKSLPSLSQMGLPLFPPPLPRQGQPDAPRWANTTHRAEDFIEGLPESDRTALNTKEFIFYGYFQRIRERLDQAWVPLLREKVQKYYRAGHQLASDMDHVTRILVVMNERGEIIRVQILSISGTQELDDAAVEAFNKAGPFPNPPKGIIDADREIKIPWDFILKT